MRSLRALLRLIALILVNLGFFVFLVVTGALVDAGGRLRGERRASGRWRTRVFHVWGGWLARLLGLRISVGGVAPRPPYFLVTNHLGYVDVVLLASQLQCVFVSKAEVRDWPVIGRLCEAVDTLFIQRGVKRDIPRVMAQIEAVMRGGRGIVVFPEGTSSGGDGVLPFRSPLLESAARSGIPVHYAAVSYRTRDGSPPAREAVCWWNDMPFPGHVWTLLGLPGFDARVEFGPEPVPAADRKELARRLHREVDRLLGTVVSGYADRGAGRPTTPEERR